MSLNPTYDIDLRRGAFHDTTPAQLDSIFQNIANAKSSTLVVYFHGGLDDEATGIEIADRLTSRFLAANAYPVFFLWESGFLQAFGDTVTDIHNSDWIQFVIKTLCRIFGFGSPRAALSEELVSPGKRDIDCWMELHYPKGRWPFASLDDRGSAHANYRAELHKDGGQFSRKEEAQLRFLIETSPQLARTATTVTATLALATPAGEPLRVVPIGAEGFSIGYLNQLASAAIRGRSLQSAVAAGLVWSVIKIAYRVASRLLSGHDHGVYPTIIEEVIREYDGDKLSSAVWGEIKKYTAEAFGADPSQYGGTRFIQRLRDLESAGHHPRIVLIGHSAGSNYICNFIAAANTVLPSSIVFDVILMAPACRFSVFTQLLATASNRLGECRMFGLSDGTECNDHMVLIIYPHSLLYFVSGVCEDDSDAPLLGMNRYYSRTKPYAPGSDSNIDGVVDYYANKGVVPIWSPAPPPPIDGQRTTAQCHGCFNSDLATLDSLSYIVANGFVRSAPT